MFADSRLDPLDHADAAPSRAMDGTNAAHRLTLLPGQALDEARALRLLARAGVRVVRRAWGPAEAAGGAPSLLLLTAPIPEALAALAAERLQADTGAMVRRLRVEHFDAQKMNENSL